MKCLDSRICLSSRGITDFFWQIAIYLLLQCVANHDSGTIQAERFLLAEYHLSISIGMNTGGWALDQSLMRRRAGETPCATVTNETHLHPLMKASALVLRSFNEAYLSYFKYDNTFHCFGQITYQRKLSIRSWSYDILAFFVTWWSAQSKQICFVCFQLYVSAADSR